ncbi:MAG: 6-carboxytetrahydropterin synthase [Gammaproteobacteria bacterium]
MNNARLTTIEISHEYLEFAAGHFTVFSSSHREKIHGHTYSVQAAITAAIQEDIGLAFDYSVYKKILRDICDKLNGYFLLAGNSPHLKITEEGDYYRVEFNNEKMLFLKIDVIVLPIVNSTIEELARWFVQQLLQDKATLDKYQVCGITIKVFSGPRQSASYQWLK